MGKTFNITVANLATKDIAMVIATKLDQGGNAKASGIVITVSEIVTADGPMERSGITPLWSNQVTGDIDD